MQFKTEECLQRNIFLSTRRYSELVFDIRTFEFECDFDHFWNHVPYITSYI